MFRFKLSCHQLNMNHIHNSHFGALTKQSYHSMFTLWNFEEPLLRSFFSIFQQLQQLAHFRPRLDKRFSNVLVIHSSNQLLQLVLIMEVLLVSIESKHFHNALVWPKCYHQKYISQRVSWWNQLMIGLLFPKLLFHLFLSCSQIYPGSGLFLGIHKVPYNCHNQYQVLTHIFRTKSPIRMDKTLFPFYHHD